MRLLVGLGWAFLALRPYPAFAQHSSYVEIEVNHGSGVGCAAEIAHFKDKSGKRIRNGRLEDYLRVESTLDWKCYVKRGGDIKAVKVEGMVAAGKGSSIELILPKKAYHQLDEFKYWRHPFDPIRLPVGGSLIIEKTKFGETNLSAAWRWVAADLDYRRSDGMAMGFTRLSKNKVQVYSGPYRGVATFLFTGLGFDFDFVELYAGGYSRHETEHYRLRTAVFDISTESGRAAYYEYFLTGKMKAVKERKGVSNVGRLYSNSNYREEGAALGAAIKAGWVTVRVGGAKAGMSLRAEANTTKYDDGGRMDTRIERYINNPNIDVQISFKSVHRPGRPPSQVYRVLLPSVERETAVRFANFARRTTWMPHAGRPDSRQKIAKRFTLQLTFTPQDLQHIKKTAKQCLDSKKCEERFSDYYEDIPEYLKRNPYPNMTLGIVPDTYKIIKHFSDPGHTDFDKYTPARVLVPFMPIEPWFIEHCFRVMEPTARYGQGSEFAKPLFEHLLLIGVKDQR